MSEGESSASIFRDNGGKHGVWCNSMDNSRAAARNSFQAFLGSRAADGQQPQGPTLHLGKICHAWELQRALVQLYQEAETPARSLLSSPKRQQQQPEQLRAQGTCKLVLGGRMFSHPSEAPAAISQKCSPSLDREEQAGEAGKKIHMDRPE